LPPSGGFLAKWLLLSAALDSSQWWWVVVIAIGGLLTAAYVIKVLAHALTTVEMPTAVATVSRGREAVVLALAIVSTLLGLLAFAPVDLVQIGRPTAAMMAR
jgi:multicomponent Na+:H+ antiporter subunit D